MARYKSVHTGPQIDSGVARALPGGEIDAQQKSSLESKAEIEFLDNTDFTNPVAQAGIGGNHGSVPFAVDRWQLISGTVSGSANGLTLNGTIRQVREYSIGFTVVPSIQMYSGTATITYDDTTKYCDIVSSGGVIKRPHLGLRAITDWTKIPTPNFDSVLASCQTYYCSSYPYGTSGAAADATCFDREIAYTGWYLYHSKISFPVNMRTAPSVLLYSEKNGALGCASEYNVAGLFVTDKAIASSEVSNKGFQWGASGGALTAGNIEKMHWVAIADLEG